jgi:quercetin dioxygenase-like cupin family protein
MKRPLYRLSLTLKGTTMAPLASTRTLAAALCALGLATILPAAAQKPGAQFPALTRTKVHRGDVAAPGHEAVVMKVELAAGGHAGRHTHPGDEISYVNDGDTTLLVDGEAPRKLKPGEAFVIKAGKVHDLRNDGRTAAHLLAVYVVKKGKPLATPAK